MSQALVATHRITQPYTVSGVQHKIRYYVKRDLGVVTPPYFIINRAATSMNWTLVAEQFAFRMGYMSQASWGPAVLEELSGTLWLPLDVYQPTGQSAGGSVQVATQTTMVLRDTAFKNFHVVFMEQTQAAPYHNIAPFALGTSQGNMQHGWLSDGADIHDPYQFQVSRGNRYLATSPFIGYTIALNRKVRRRRGLA